MAYRRSRSASPKEALCPQERHAGSRAALRRVFEMLIADKAGGVHYLAGDKLLGGDGEATVDGSHPTDLGFVRQADAFMPALAALLPQPEKQAPIEGYTDK